MNKPQLAALSLAAAVTLGFADVAQIGSPAAVALASFTAAQMAAYNRAMPPVGPISPEQAASNVRNAARPLRDLYRLAEQVKLKTTLKVPRQISDAPPAYSVGDINDFWIADQDNKNYFSIKATLLHQSEHVHWWVQNGKNVDVTQLRASADRFETEILPKDRELYGLEATPGIDGDNRITVLIATTPGAGGYFSASDSYPKLVNPHSNERKMIYMNAESARPGSNNFLATLAHEYQHMIHRNVRPGDQGWIDEGMSVLAEKLNGFGQGGLPAAFLARPGTQLNTWSDDAARATNHYGASFLWVDYFFSHYGGYDGMKDYLKLAATDRASFDKYLETLGRSERFDDVFADWVVANLVNDKTSANTRWGYFDSTGKTSRVEEVRPGTTKSAAISQYGTMYYQLNGSGPVEIAFQGDPTTRLIATDAPSGTGMWWGNRGDDMNTSMTRQVDLSGVSSATLNVSLWYSIEDGFDYGYVEVSDNNGQTWTTLKGRHSTADDPNGQNLGNGYTAKSGGGETPAWVKEQIDLTPWAGKPVLLRFEYVTDDAYNAPGFAWDDLSIPEIGLTDDGEDDGAWTTNGFVRLGNVVPEHYIVQVVTRGENGTQVQRVNLGDNQSGSLTLQGLGADFKDAWIAVSGTAEWTTEPASFTLDVRQK